MARPRRASQLHAMASWVVTAGVVAGAAACADPGGITTTGPTATTPPATSLPTSSTTAARASGTTSTTPTNGRGPGGTAPARNRATPPPSWLGTRVLRQDSSGAIPPQRTPPELVDRRIVTIDELPPPEGGRFSSRVTAVPTEVAARSTWTTGCPVTLDDLRYVTVAFRGFEGRAHTGELLLHRSVAHDMVTVFRRLFDAGFPIERMRITSPEELAAAPTGDGNTTGGFVCRRAVGSTRWSEHALGRAIDVNPFQNPYVKGRVLIPELARAYTDRSRRRVGMIAESGPVVEAFARIGWEWGGHFGSAKDWMHFSVNGR